MAPKEPEWSLQEQSLIVNQIARLKEKGVISRAETHPKQFISRIFLIEKQDGSHRLILNLKMLNKFIDTEHFKLEDHKTVSGLLSQNWFLASIDLKDAYYLIPIRRSDRKYLRFMFQGNLFEFNCLPFGLNTAPYTFTKLLKPVVSYLRNQGYVSVNYLDDFLLLGDSVESCESNVRETCKLLSKLGFIINEQKSKLIPSKRCKFLGLIFDSQKMSVELPKEKTG